AARRDPARAPANGWGPAIAAEVDRTLARSLRPVINATGVVLHTNLGRAPLAEAALAAMADVASGYSNLEYDVAAGTRGSRHAHCTALLRELTGAEDAMVVNNCAAALVLALAAHADGREAIISRGELVEIGGSFRVPEIMAASGAHLVEVGTTNRTHAADYERAVTDRTAAIVSVHRSNFVQEGFVASVRPAELAPVAARAGIALVHDFGSGLMLDLSAWGLAGEPTAPETVRTGATLVLMSGDKLLGGPQAGIVLGRAKAVDAMRRHPLARAVRVDKLTLAALEATLELYRRPADAVAGIPVLRMLTVAADDVRARATAVAADLAQAGAPCTVVATDATVGGGAFPTARIPSAAVRLDGAPAAAMDATLRAARLPVVGRAIEDRLHLDLRTVPEAHDEVLVDVVRAAVAS
ncbi:MAG: L-seryl-tRNA(Sec) selenium transferase, partial [Gemmatimonadota bacterium]|nr:L-seryl-tRNA(Sec) selenium transferase [Gemmatimonadota bacterium]